MKKIILLLAILAFTNPIHTDAEKISGNYTAKANYARIDKIEVIQTNVDGKDGDLVKLTLEKGDYDYNKIVTYDVKTGEQRFHTIINSSNTQYVSLKNGTYQFIVQDRSGQFVKFPQNVIVSKSCTDEVKNNIQGKVSVNRCYIYDGTSTIKMANANTRPMCASGYVRDQNSGYSSTTCEKNGSDLSKYSLNARYCRVVEVVSCIKANTNNSTKLADLSVSTGTLSPSFNPNTKSYKMSTSASSVTIGAELQNDGSSFVSGFGPRTVNVGYGTTNAQIKVKSSSGNITTYTIAISKPDSRDHTNTLKSLNIGFIDFDQAFNANTTKYTAKVTNDVEEIVINAEKTSSKSQYVSGFTPGRKYLKAGLNTFYVKVMSESKRVKVYTIQVTREGKPELPATKDLYLKEIEIGTKGAVMSPQFNKEITQYSIIVPPKTTELLINPIKENESHELKIEGNKDFKNDIINPVKITLTDPTTKETKVYEFSVVISEEEIKISADSKLKFLEIKNYKINFKEDKKEYDLIVKEGTKKLEIDAKASSEKAELEIIGNEKLKDGSVITIKVTAEDGSVTPYKIKIDVDEDGTNIFVVILIIIVIVLALIYLVLRIMGYRININFDFLTNKMRKRK